MIQYADNRLASLQTDALLVEVDCMGCLTQSPLALCEQSLPEVVAAYKTAFADGKVEPGIVLSLDRGDLAPKRVFLLPTRVHPNGALRDKFVAPGIADIVEQVLRQGIKSLGVLVMQRDTESVSSGVKLPLVSAFARVPAVKLVWVLSHQTTKHVTIFSDGGAAPNPGIGGYGVVLRFGATSKELSGGFRLTNSNRMELLAAIAGLEALKHPCRVRLYSDSRYVVDAVNQGWLFRLAAKNWDARKTYNVDLWKRFLDAYLRHEVELVWVKGHAGIVDNERCDELASLAMQQSELSVDKGYKPSSAATSLKVKSAPQASASGSAKPKHPGDPCRNCGASLIRRETKKHNPRAAYWFAWYLYCESCQRIYHVRAAKITREANDS